MAYSTIHDNELIKQIPLTQGLVAIVDSDDYESLCKIKWQAHGQTKKYAVHSKQMGSRFIKIQMHRLIIGTPAGMVTDHINGDTLDNRKQNLRICTTAQNARNLRDKKREHSPYKGVTLRPGYDKWQATICVNYRRIHIGVYPTPEEAALAYNEAARHFFGEFATLNTVPGDHAAPLVDLLKPRKPKFYNKCGFAGVTPEPKTGKFMARITIHGERKYLGLFDTPEAASEARRLAKHGSCKPAAAEDDLARLNNER